MRIEAAATRLCQSSRSAESYGILNCRDPRGADLPGVRAGSVADVVQNDTLAATVKPLTARYFR